MGEFVNVQGLIMQFFYGLSDGNNPETTEMKKNCNLSSFPRQNLEMSYELAQISEKI